MSRLLVALDPSAEVGLAEVMAAWNADPTAAVAGVARIEAVGPGTFIPGLVEMLVIPLGVNLASSAVYDILKGVLKNLRDNQQGDLALSDAHASGEDLMIVVLSAAHQANDDS